MKKTFSRLVQVCQLGVAAYLLWYGWPGFFQFLQNRHHLWFFAILCGAAIVLGQKPVPLNPMGNLWLSLSDVISYLVVFTFPFSVCVWFFVVTNYCLVLSQQLAGRYPVKFDVFLNPASQAITLGAGVFVFDQFAAGNSLAQLFFKNDWRVFPLVFLVWFVVMGLYCLITASVDVISLNTGYFEALHSFSEFVQYEDLISVFLGALIAILLPSHPYAVMMMAGPVFVFWLASEMNARSFMDFSALIHTLLRTLEFSSPLEYSHGQRVAYYVEALARKLGKDKLEAKEMYELGLIQDLGVITISDRIMYKMDPLSPEEWAIMRKHPLETVKFVKHIPRYQKHLFALESHHERWDGSGYPRGLAGEAIPYAARLLAVADAYDAMMGDYPFRKKLSRKVALRRIWMGRNKQFDPHMVKALFLYADEFEPVIKLPFKERPLIWVIAEAIGRELGLSARELDDLHEAAIMHEVNPPFDIFARSGKLNPYGPPVHCEDHVGTIEALREDFPSSEEALKILMHHHDWVEEHVQKRTYVLMGSWVLAVAEGLADYIMGGMGWSDGLEKIKQREGRQFHRDVIASLERVLATGAIPSELLLGQVESA